MKISEESIDALAALKSGYQGTDEEQLKEMRAQLEAAVNALYQLEYKLPGSSPALMAVALGVLTYLEAKREGYPVLDNRSAALYASFVQAGYELAGSDYLVTHEERIPRKKDLDPSMN